MKRFTLYILTVFTLLSCGGSKSQFRLKGEFKHLEQGEFYLYSADGINKFDTLKIINGEFDYTTELDHQAIYHLLYPNFSELVIFASPGDKIKIEGDARNLKTTEVSGSEANKDFTEFRLKNQDKNDIEERKAAQEFIKTKPESPVSIFLFKQYFLLNANADKTETKKLYQTLLEAQPHHKTLIGWKDDVEVYSRPYTKGTLLPDFSLEINGDTIKRSDYKGKYLLLNFWASWEDTSSPMLFRIKRFYKKHQEKLKVLSISLDVDKRNLKNVERNDSVFWPDYCDFNAWNSPLIRLFHITDIPCCFFVGPDHRIIATGSDFEKEIQPVIEKTLNLK